MTGEARIQAIVIGHLRAAGWRPIHVPNEGTGSARRGARLKREGVTAGVSDVLLFESPPANLNFVGLALELKTAAGEDGAASRGRLSEAQKAWQIWIASQGWACAVCYGSADALATLRRWGYL